jgi:hypothetical protein
VWTVGSQQSVRSVAGDRVLLEEPVVHGTTLDWAVSVVEVATGRSLGRADCGGGPLAAVAFSGKLVAVLNNDRRLLFFAVP